MKKPRFIKIPANVEIMKLDDFILNCISGAFINYDGHGYYGTEKWESDKIIMPSTVILINAQGWKYPKWATHVVWYNR